LIVTRIYVVGAIVLTAKRFSYDSIAFTILQLFSEALSTSEVKLSPMYKGKKKICVTHHHATCDFYTIIIGFNEKQFAIFEDIRPGQLVPTDAPNKFRKSNSYRNCQ
jgi:hypothetical protein